MKEKPVLLIDQDDVLAEYIKGVTESFNEKYDTKFCPSECTTWDLTSVFGEDITKVMHEPQLFENLEPVPYALEVFERLYRSNLFNMYIVTAANPRSVEAKFTWLKKYLSFFPQEKVIICMNKYMIEGDYLLDDGMHNINDFEKVGKKAIVFERPHNVNLIKNHMSVKNWLEFERLIINMCYPNYNMEYFQENKQVQIS
ncbi:MAG: hypothetical protein AB9856_12845 [Cellulosilyticaceae bacterium]